MSIPCVRFFYKKIYLVPVHVNVTEDNTKLPGEDGGRQGHKNAERARVTILK